jgi:hypothetical protein
MDGSAPSPPASPRSVSDSGDGEIKEARLRFRLRPRSNILPELTVDHSGVVANSSGLTLQATNPANFILDTLRYRQKRHISAGKSLDAADGLLRLYTRLTTLKGGRYQRESRAEGKLARVLDHVAFTDKTVGPEWDQWIMPRVLRDPRAFRGIVGVLEEDTVGDEGVDPGATELDFGELGPR